MRDVERHQREKARPRTPMPTLDEARAVKLMGQSSSWDGFGGRALDVIPDGTLRKARAWFSVKIREDGAKPGMERMRAQRAAITVVLADRTANAPQMELLPELEARPTPTDAELLARVQADDDNDGLPF